MNLGIATFETSATSPEKTSISVISDLASHPRQAATSASTAAASIAVVSQPVASVLRPVEPNDSAVFGPTSQMSQMSRRAPAPTWDDYDEERAASVEHDCAIPRAWADGYGELCAMPPPDGFSPQRWQRIVDGA